MNHNDNQIDAQALEVLSELDESTITGLKELAEESPELLEQMLDDLGYLPTANAEATTQAVTADLAPANKRLREALEGMGSPRTADEIVDFLEEERLAFIDEYQSAKHRSWVSTKLNELVEAGSLGRFRDGRAVRYTLTPVEAVRHWALHNSEFVENLDISDAREIAEDTGMAVRSVRKALENLEGETEP